MRIHLQLSSAYHSEPSDSLAFDVHDAVSLFAIILIGSILFK